MIVTELRREREDGFVVRTDEEDFQAVLPGLAYARDVEGDFVRWFPPSVGAPTIYERFSGCIDELLAHAARREAPPWAESLKRLHRALAGAGVDWMLSGSAALAVRGVAVIPRDIDFIVADHTSTARALDDLLIEPPLAMDGWVAAWFGRAWNGMRVEWAADTRPDLDEHDWTSDIGPTATARAETVEWHGLDFRLPPLDLQLAVSRERGLQDRVGAIEAHLRHDVTG